MRKIVLASLLACALIACGREQPNAPAARSEPDSAADFSVETFDGDTFALAEQRGTPVVLNFFESW